MNHNEAQKDEIDELEEIYDFIYEMCSRYHLGKQSGQLDYRAFGDWVVLEAGMLYVKYVLQPDSAQC